MAKCKLTSYHKCVHSTILDVGVYYLPPLCYIHRFNDPWYLIHKSDGSSDMLQHFYISNLLPRHWHVVQEFHNCKRHLFQCIVIKYNAHKQNVKMKKINLICHNRKFPFHMTNQKMYSKSVTEKCPHAK